MKVLWIQVTGRVYIVDEMANQRFDEACEAVNCFFQHFFRKSIKCFETNVL